MENSPGVPRDSRPSIRTVLLILAGMFVLVVVSGAVIAYLAVRTSNDASPAPATTSAVFDPVRQQALVQLYESVKSADAALDGLAAASDADPHSDTPYQRLIDATQTCKDSVEQYNEAVDSASAGSLPASMPAEIGQDPATDCQPAVPSPSPSQ